MAIELPVKQKYRDHVNGHHKSTSGNGGTNKHRGETDKKRKEAAQEATRDNQMVMVLDQGRKIRWYRAADWYGTAGRDSAA